MPSKLSDFEWSPRKGVELFMGMGWNVIVCPHFVCGGEDHFIVEYTIPFGG